MTLTRAYNITTIYSVFNPNFDPLADLKRLEKSHDEMRDQLNECILIINRQSQAIADLHGRLRLLEMVRQNEDSITTTLRNIHDLNREK